MLLGSPRAPHRNAPVFAGIHHSSDSRPPVKPFENVTEALNRRAVNRVTGVFFVHCC